MRDLKSVVDCPGSASLSAAAYGLHHFPPLISILDTRLTTNTETNSTGALRSTSPSPQSILLSAFHVLRPTYSLILSEVEDHRAS